MIKPRKKRLVRFEPSIKHFKPQGVPISDLKEVVLTIDELEAIRLADLENLDQTAAAQKMDISQSTFHRILTSAHQKVAGALVKGYAIKMEGGEYQMVFGKGRGRRQGRMGGPLAAGPGGICVCPSCGHETIHQAGTPCVQTKCEKCGTTMIRKR